MSSDFGLKSCCDTEADTDFVGKEKAGSALAPLRPEPAHRSSSSRYILSSLSRASMLYSLSHHALLICKIYRKGWPGYL